MHHEGRYDPFEDLRSAAAHYQEGDLLLVCEHNLADIHRTWELGELVRAFVPAKDVTEKKLIDLSVSPFLEVQEIGRYDSAEAAVRSSYFVRNSWMSWPICAYQSFNNRCISSAMTSASTGS